MKLFEVVEMSRMEIEAWCGVNIIRHTARDLTNRQREDLIGRDKYVIHDDMSVSIYGNLSFDTNRKTNKAHSIPFKVREMIGEIHVANEHGNFESFENFPEELDGSITLRGLCRNGFKGFPKLISGYVTITGSVDEVNPPIVHNIDGFSREVDGIVQFENIHFTSFKGFPREVGQYISFRRCIFEEDCFDEMKNSRLKGHYIACKVNTIGHDGYEQTVRLDTYNLMEPLSKTYEKIQKIKS